MEEIFLTSHNRQVNGRYVVKMPIKEGALPLGDSRAVEEKFRVVFDGSSKTTNGKSFSDIQMVGEKLQLDLADQLMRFRFNLIAIVADV